MLRVLQVIKAMDRAGAETLIMNLYRHIDRDRLQFDFLVHTDKDCDYDDEIRSLGGQIYRIPYMNGINILRYKKSVRSFFREHPEHAIVHGHLGSSAYIYLKEAKLAGRIAIAHAHRTNGRLTNPANIAFSLAASPSRFVADYYLACSKEAGHDRFGNKRITGPRFHVLANGIDIDAFACTDAMHAQAKAHLGLAESLIIGHVGRMEPEKNHRFLLQVFAKTAERVPSARLVLVGSGSLRAALQESCRSLGIADKVTFLGAVDDVASALQAFDLFVFPSAYEGLGMALVEAQASGLPCIASAAVPRQSCIAGNVVRLSLRDGVNAWASQCTAILRKKSNRQDNSRILRESGFDIADSARWLQAYYDSIVGNAGGTDKRAATMATGVHLCK